MNPKTKPPISQDNTRISVPEFSKTDVRFWRDRLFKRTTDDWQVQIGFAGIQERFPLGTPNKDAAAGKARDIYMSLHASGWEPTRTKFKPWTKLEEKVPSPTVGEFLEAVGAVAVVKPTTLKQYVRKFRRLVSGVIGITGGKEKFDYVGEGAAQWRSKVDNVKLSNLTPTRITEWRVEYLKAATGNPLKHRHAQFTIASLLRSSMSLFSETKILPYLKHLTLPSPMPFEGITIGKLPRTRYQSKINAQQLLLKARKGLRHEPECWKIFLLAFGAGLRRDEIDSLTWGQFNWAEESISVEVNEYGDTKTETSADEIKVDSGLLAELKSRYKKRTGDFVIESTRAPSPSANWNRYRCDPHFKRLLRWLRENGVNGHNPMHTLRKEFGSIICKQAGIFAASTALRHANINLTREHYVDGGRVALPLGEMLEAKPKKSKNKPRVKKRNARRRR